MKEYIGPWSTVRFWAKFGTEKEFLCRTIEGDIWKTDINHAMRGLEKFLGSRWYEYKIRIERIK